MAQNRKRFKNVIDDASRYTQSVIDDFSKGDIPDSIRRDFRDTYDFYVTDLDTWEAVGRAHGAVFGDIRPASTLVQVAGLIDPDMLVEIEAEAVVGAGNDR